MWLLGKHILRRDDHNAYTYSLGSPADLNRRDWMIVASALPSRHGTTQLYAGAVEAIATENPLNAEMSL